MSHNKLISLITHIRIQVILFLLLPLLVFPQTLLNYKIANWKDDKKAAVSLTFDDAIEGQFRYAVPLINKYGIRASFFLTIKHVDKQLKSWKPIQQASLQGHEMGNHSMTHPSLAELNIDQIREELLKSNLLIDSAIKPQKSLCHAYPNGSGGGETDGDIKVRNEVKRYFIGARASQVQDTPLNLYDFASADSYYKINSEMINEQTTSEIFKSRIDEVLTLGGWYVPTYHGIENGWIIVKKETFEGHLKELAMRKDELWIAPFGEVLRYHKERNSAKIEIMKEDKTSWVLMLSDTLKENIVWNVSLTIHLKKPDWRIKKIEQGNAKIPYRILNNEIVFNAVPNIGLIEIYKY